MNPEYSMAIFKNLFQKPYFRVPVSYDANIMNFYQFHYESGIQYGYSQERNLISE